MRARHILGFILVSALAVGLAPAASSGYVVVLKDGSWVRAAEKPVVEDGEAQIRLKNGLLALLPDSEIDWPRSDRKSRQLEILFAAENPEHPDQAAGLPSHPTGVPGTLTLGSPAVGGTGGGEAGTLAAPTNAPADPNAAIRTRLAAINLEINNLQGKKANLLDQMSREWNLDKKAKIRNEVAGLDTRIQDLRREQSRLLLQRIGQ